MKRLSWLLGLGLLVGGLMGCAAVPMKYPVYVCDNEADPSLDQYPNDKNVCTAVLSQVSATVDVDPPSPMMLLLTECQALQGQVIVTLAPWLGPTFWRASCAEPKPASSLAALRDQRTQTEFDEANLLRYVPVGLLTLIGCIGLVWLVSWGQDWWQQRRHR